MNIIKKIFTLTFKNIMNHFGNIKCMLGIHSTRMEKQIFTLNFGRRIKEYRIGYVEYCNRCGKTIHKYSLKRISKEDAEDFILKRKRKQKLKKLKYKEIQSADYSDELKDLFERIEEIKSDIRS